MPITIAEIRKIATLARVKLTLDEERRYAETISAVLDYMKILNEVDTAKVEPTAQVTGLENVYRDDVPVKAPNKEALVFAMPAVMGNELKVPGVFAADEYSL